MIYALWALWLLKNYSAEWQRVGAGEICQNVSGVIIKFLFLRMFLKKIVGWEICYLKSTTYFIFLGIGKTKLFLVSLNQVT